MVAAHHGTADLATGVTAPPETAALSKKDESANTSGRSARTSIKPIVRTAQLRSR